MFLHYLANDNDILNRDDMNSNNQIFKNQLIMAIELSEIFLNDNVKKKCDYICQNNNENGGVKEALEKFILSNE